ncbi:MAG: ABC transporter permease [Devosiaceae bacterium]|nr:ABC transporter permease [Devosiaceae bacterium MH13]
MGELFGLIAWGPTGWGDEIAAGAWLTIRLAVVTLPFGLLLGLAIALAKESSNSYLRAVGNVYTTVFRGLPELLTLFVIYNMVQIGANRLTQMIAPGSQFEISGFAAGVIALGVVFGAFASEVFLGAIRAIPKGQSEAGRSLGLSPWQTFRLVRLPQLWRLALPGLGNLWLVLLKDTSLVSVIALNDLLRQTQVAVGVTKEPFFFYLIACLIYLFFTLISQVGVNRLEAQANRGFAAR